MNRRVSEIDQFSPLSNSNTTSHSRKDGLQGGNRNGIRSVRRQEDVVVSPRYHIADMLNRGDAFGQSQQHISLPNQNLRNGNGVISYGHHREGSVSANRANNNHPAGHGNFGPYGGLPLLGNQTRYTERLINGDRLVNGDRFMSGDRTRNVVVGTYHSAGDSLEKKTTTHTMQGGRSVGLPPNTNLLTVNGDCYLSYDYLQEKKKQLQVEDQDIELKDQDVIPEDTILPGFLGGAEEVDPETQENVTLDDEDVPADDEDVGDPYEMEDNPITDVPQNHPRIRYGAQENSRQQSDSRYSSNRNERLRNDAEGHSTTARSSSSSTGNISSSAGENKNSPLSFKSVEMSQAILASTLTKLWSHLASNLFGKWFPLFSSIQNGLSNRFFDMNMDDL